MIGLPAAAGVIGGVLVGRVADMVIPFDPNVPKREPPTFRSEVTVWHPAWILVGVLAVTLFLTRHGR